MSAETAAGATESNAGNLNQSMQPSSHDTASELSVRVVKNLLLEFQRRFGRDRLVRVFAEKQVSPSLSYLESPENFVAVSVFERLATLFTVESGDENFVRTAAEKTMSRESLGFAYLILKALSSPRAGFEKIVKLGPTFNRVGTFHIRESDSNRLVLEYKSLVPESNRTLCQTRKAQFGAVPTIWGVPPAEVDEVQCQLSGAESCVYRLKWNTPSSAWQRYFFVTLIGTALGVGTAFVASLPSMIAAGVVGGLLVAAWLDARSQIRQKDEQLKTQSVGLEESLQDLRRRHDELNEINEELNRINLELEQRVKERTIDLEHAKQSLEVALQSQKEIDRKKTEFFDNVSHELRTPLTIILLSLESLLQRPADSLPLGSREHLMAMERSAARLLRLINNLLDLAKLEAGKRRLSYQPVEFTGFLRSLLIPFKIPAKEKKLNLELRGGASTPVLVDAEMMDVVFQNLVSNALKFTTSGGVTISVSENEQNVLVEVADTGQGMAAADLHVIFDRFSQADSSGLRRFGGTGIGLALVKETVELHGGSIAVTSEPEKGSAFTVSIPKGDAHVRDELKERRLAEVPVRRDRRSSGDLVQGARPISVLDSGVGDSSGSHTELPADAKTVLVVDDDAEIRRYVVGILQEHFRVREANNGQEGLRIATDETPDLVLSDVMMPVMSGLQLTHALRQQAATAEIPVILLTARQEVEARLSGFSAGASDYVGKPFAPRELLARVEAQIRIREAASRATANDKLSVLGLLSSGFAHEVRNPLNAILNALEALRHLLHGQKTDGDAANTFIRVIEESGTRVSQLADNLLSFARPANREELVDVVAGIESTLQVLQWKTPAAVKVGRNYRARDRIRGDAGALNLVWANLIDNSLRAIGSGGNLVVSTDLEPNRVVVRIADTGSGIPPSVRGRLFEPFVSGQSPSEGTGLGLALCKRIVLQHGGTIQVEESNEKGTTFVVRLPALNVQR
ncbi:MAG: ATP-binding protein [Myxococcaceae bacterium]